MAEALVGTWVVDRNDRIARKQFGEVTIRFDADGALTYVVRENGRDQIIMLRYRVEGDELITNQPSAPSEERTKFGFTTDGRLVLNYEGMAAHYVRQTG